MKRSPIASGLFAVAIALSIAGCMTRPPAPVIERTPLSIAPQPPPALPADTPREREPEAAPVPTYTVKRGDTLAQIALDNGLDYRELATWNGLDNPNVIRVGQVLVMAAPGSTPAPLPAPGTATTTPLAAAPPVAPRVAEPATPQGTPILPSGRNNTATLKSEPRSLKLPYSEQTLAQMQASAAAAPATTVAAAAPAAAPPAPAPPAASPTAGAPASATAALPARPDAARVPEIDDDKLGWIWPSQGKVIAGFSDSANLKGIDIAGKVGQPVVASAAGRVVYAGAGLRGYGKLIIVKHNSTFLSAYAHNRELVVKEGQQVAKGQKISEMGDSDADQVKLHFEIRRLGKPVDPAKYLPPA
ncbi:MAG: peptidoglycan DD-metalloendopeptidase family protein [Betaproteobacteria bacterium]